MRYFEIIVNGAIFLLVAAKKPQKAYDKAEVVWNEAHPDMPFENQTVGVIACY